MGAAVMTPGEVRAAYQAALERLRGTRRNPNAGPSEAERRRAWVEGRELPRFDLYAPQFRPPSAAAEFFDDRLIEWGKQGFAEAPVMVTIAAAARDGAAAAVAAVKTAKQLGPAAQWNVYQNLDRWRKDDDAARTGADRTVAAVLGEWSRLRLPEQDPAPEEPAKRRRRRWETEAERATA